MKPVIRLFGLFILLLSSGIVLAHPVILPHVQTTSEATHILSHLLMILPFGLAAYFVGRWLLRKKTATCRVQRKR